jgi:hypothetical protein
MNAFQSALSSPRFNRMLLWSGAIILTLGVGIFLFALAGGNDKTTYNPDKGFKATLPVDSKPLTNGNGTTIKAFSQLDPQVRSTIRTFLATAVARKHLDKSWPVLAPTFRKGYTLDSWSHAKALPVVPYPIDNVDKAEYYLDYASTREILVEVGLAAPKGVDLRPTSFQLGLSPFGTGANKKWLVDYWMPRWTPPIPTNQ